MSNINNVYSTIRTVIPTITGITSKKELTNPESLKDNNSNLLKDGWGVIVGEITPFGDQIMCHSMFEARFSVVITKESFNSIADPTKAFNTNDELLKNAVDIQKTFLDSDKLGIPNYLGRVDFLGTSAIEFVNGEKYNIRAITINFNFLITEQLG